MSFQPVLPSALSKIIYGGNSLGTLSLYVGGDAAERSALARVALWSLYPNSFFTTAPKVQEDLTWRIETISNACLTQASALLIEENPEAREEVESHLIPLIQKTMEGSLSLAIAVTATSLSDLESHMGVQPLQDILARIRFLIFLRSDDQMTTEYARRFSPAVDLSQLEPWEFMVHDQISGSVQLYKLQDESISPL